MYLQKADEVKELTLNAFNLTDPLFIFLQFAFIIGIILTSPIILYQIWAFVSPGLYEKERKVTLSYIPISIVLFVGGVSFSYYILFPLVVDFMKRVSNDLDVNQVIRITEYFHFLFMTDDSVRTAVSDAGADHVFNETRCYHAEVFIEDQEVRVFCAACDRRDDCAA